MRFLAICHQLAYLDYEVVKMVNVQCTECGKGILVKNYRLIISDEMVLRVYEDTCSNCEACLEFYWHENKDQYSRRGLLEYPII